MIVGVLTTCHTQYTSDSSICIFLFNRTILQVFVTYLTGSLYVHPLWFYKHQHDTVEITNKMQPCNRIHRSTVHLRLNMFRAAYDSSSGVLTVFAVSGLHTHVVTGRSQVCVGTDDFYYKIASCWLFLLSQTTMHGSMNINPLNPELNPICYLLALLGDHHFL